MHLIRSRFLGSVLGAAGLSLLGTPVRAESIAVKIATLPIDPTAAVYYAQHMGFFEQAGLEATIAPFTNGSATASALVGGAVEVALVDTVTMASAHSRGVPILYLAPGAIYTKKAQTYWLIVAHTSSIHGARDFAGKTIAVNGIQNINQIPTEAWIDNNGGDSQLVKFVEMPYPAMVPALEGGKIDCAAVTEPTLSLTRGKFRVISLAEKNLAPSFLVAGYAAKTDWIDQHTEAVKRFVTAMARTNGWANAHHPQSAAILAEISKLSPAVAARMVRAQYGEHLAPALIQPVIDATAKYGVIPKPFRAADVIAAAAIR